MKIKSSFCGNSTCVEVEMVSDPVRIIVYDTFGNRCVYTHEEWKAFLAGVRAGEFDLKSLQN